jgi:alpha-tubulin suppressor-like RCC1 family protein
MRSTHVRRLPRLHPAMVLAAGLLALPGCGSEQPSPTAPDERPSPAVSAVAALSFFQLSASWLWTCGVTTDNRAYCWGNNDQGYLGDGTIIDRAAPVAVLGGLRFRHISGGGDVTCAVTTDFHGYCWGNNQRGELGDGTTTERHSPVAVVGGLRFRQIEVGFLHACGLTYPDNRVYCWGWNRDGQLGLGTRTGPEGCSGFGPCSTKPVPISSTLTFRQVTAGWYHSCAVTTDERLFCWGLNSSGQVGDSTSVFRRANPSRVGRSQRWRQVDGGIEHTCAVTTGDQAFCWGNGRDGQLGNGHTYLSFWPRAVAGEHAFRRVTAGGGHTCGETPSNGAWCWGAGGALGDGTTTQSLIPVAVTGGLFFSQLSAGRSYTCGRTPAGVGYCWGTNANGQLGLGAVDFVPHPSPTPIGAPM